MEMATCACAKWLFLQKLEDSRRHRVGSFLDACSHLGLYLSPSSIPSLHWLPTTFPFPSDSHGDPTPRTHYQRPAPACPSIEQPCFLAFLGLLACSCPLKLELYHFRQEETTKEKLFRNPTFPSPRYVLLDGDSFCNWFWHGSHTLRSLAVLVPLVRLTRLICLHRVIAHKSELKGGLSCVLQRVRSAGIRLPTGAA